MQQSDDLQSAIDAMATFAETAKERGYVPLPGIMGGLSIWRPSPQPGELPVLMIDANEYFYTLTSNGRLLGNFDVLEQAVEIAREHLPHIGAALYYPHEASGSGCTLTVEQLATFSREWRGMFDDLVGQGWRVSRDADVDGFALNIKRAGVEIIVYDFLGLWTVRLWKPNMEDGYTRLSCDEARAKIYELVVEWGYLRHGGAS